MSSSASGSSGRSGWWTPPSWFPRRSDSDRGPLYPRPRQTDPPGGLRPDRRGSPGLLGDLPDDGSTYFSGGAGLSSTIGDYARFLQMLLNRGELDGVRLIKPETVDLMTRNQIGDLRIAFPNHGDGFGFGFGVLTDRGKTEAFRRAAYDDVATVGTFSWGGSSTPISGRIPIGR